MSILVTGPQWVPRGYFEEFYEQSIREAFAAGRTFRVGAADGVDAFAQELLVELCAGDEAQLQRVCVYDKGAKDGRKSTGFQLKNGFASYPARDAGMAEGADGVICALPQYGGGVSGALVPLLTVLKLPATAHLDAIRLHSETWSPEVLEKHIVPLYKELYPERSK